MRFQASEDKPILPVEFYWLEVLLSYNPSCPSVVRLVDWSACHIFLKVTLPCSYWSTYRVPTDDGRCPFLQLFLCVFLAEQQTGQKGFIGKL